MKRSLLYVAFCALALAAGARTLSPDQALARMAAAPDADAARRAVVRPGMEPRLMHTELTPAGEPALYVFASPVKPQGYLILAADDVAYPVLGYADSGYFDPAGMPEAMKWWLQQYADQISYVKANSIDVSRFANAPLKARQAIEPLIKTDWDQAEPYNLQCPLPGGVPTYTGCVATAMAQIMYYWRYPERGTGTVSYNAETIQKRLEINFARKAFDWDNMLLTYTAGSYDDTQAAAVAYLMKACGYSVRMDYGTDSSGALAMNIANAFVNYFKYDGNIDYQLRQYYSASQWEDLMYENLRDVGPVMYGGGSLIGGGHSFICDGYSSDGYFHFNWGWTGMSNGYFLLNALNPYALGAGGGSGGGYNFTQDAVFGIQPPTGKPVVEKAPYLTQCGSLGAEIVDGKLCFALYAEGDPMWVNYNPQTLKVQLGARIVPQGSTPGDEMVIPTTPRRFSLDPGYGISSEYLVPSVDLDSLNLPDGTYKFQMVFCDPEETDPQWIDIRPNYNNHAHVILSRAGDEYTVTIPEAWRLDIVDGGAEGGVLYDGCSHRIFATVVNDTPVELTTGLAPFVLARVTTSYMDFDEEGEIVVRDTTYVTSLYLGESVMVTLQPGETLTRTWNTDLYLLQNISIEADTEAYLTFFDEMTYNYFIDQFLKPMPLKANPGVPYLETVWAPKVNGVASKLEKVDDQRVVVYQVNDPKNIEVSCTVELKRGYCAYPVYACIISPNQDNPGQIDLENFAGQPMFLPNVGDRGELTATLSLPNPIPGQIYQLTMAFGYGQSMVQIGPKIGYFRFGTSAVDDLLSDDVPALVFADGVVSARDEEAVIELFSVSGQCVARAVGSVSLQDYPAGVYIARSGAHTLKVAR